MLPLLPLSPTVTASEAGQQKRLLLLDTDWQQLDSIPIDIGRRYFNLATHAAAAAAAAAAPAPGSNAAVADSNAADGSADGDTAVTSTDTGSDQDLDLSSAAAGEGGGHGGGSMLLDVGAVQQLVAAGAVRPGDVVQVNEQQEHVAIAARCKASLMDPGWIL